MAAEHAENEGAATTDTPVDYVCWCDGSVTCGGRAKEEYGLCRNCLLAGHSALPPLPFSLEDNDA
jgi:hypothetical protein